MWSKFSAILMLLLSSRISSMADHILNIELCNTNELVDVQVLIRNESRRTCQCQTSSPETAKLRDDYINTPGIGSHKLHTIAKTWNEARRICQEENAHLAIINSKAEERVLLDELTNKTARINYAADRVQAYLGIHDYFQEGEWLTVFGQSIHSTGYDDWSTNWHVPQPDNYEIENCGTLVIKGGMNDVKCRNQYAFFCEIAFMC